MDEKCSFCWKPLKRGEHRICRRCAALMPLVVKVAEREAKRHFAAAEIRRLVFRPVAVLDEQVIKRRGTKRYFTLELSLGKRYHIFHFIRIEFSFFRVSEQYDVFERKDHVCGKTVF